MVPIANTSGLGLAPKFHPMFIGHYAAAFALKGKEKESSLGWLFIAVQFVDILFFPFVLLGLERLDFVEGYTQTNDFKMEFPYTHGLLGTLVWALLFGVGYYLLLGQKRANGKRIAMVLALGVLSHWLADLLVHTPDLPLVHGKPKLGFGLWHNKLVTVVLEAVLLALSVWYYLKRTKPTSAFGKYAAIGLATFLLLINYLNYYILPPSHDLVGLTISALFSFFFFAGLAFWVDRKRI